MGNVDELMEGEGANINSRQTSQDKMTENSISTNVPRLLFTCTLPKILRLIERHRSSTTHPTRAQTFMTVFFFFIPAIAARNNSQRAADSENPAYFQSAVRRQSSSEMKSDSEM